MTLSHTGLARRYLEAELMKGRDESERPAIKSGLKRGDHDDDPRMDGYLAKAIRWCSSVGHHGQKTSVTEMKNG